MYKDDIDNADEDDAEDDDDDDDDNDDDEDDDDDDDDDLNEGRDDVMVKIEELTQKFYLEYSDNNIVLTFALNE